MKYKIRYGLGGGLARTVTEEIVEASNLDAAIEWAYESACEAYESYSYATGQRSVDEIMSSDGVGEEEAEEIWSEDRERWLVYGAVEVAP